MSGLDRSEVDDALAHYNDPDLTAEVRRLQAIEDGLTMVTLQTSTIAPHRIVMINTDDETEMMFPEFKCSMLVDWGSVRKVGR